MPKRILAHGFVNIGGEKISKSLGNGIDPHQIIDSYGVDAFRYFFARHIPTTEDGDFTWEKFENAYNNELGNDLGNLVQRVAAMITRYQAGVIGDSPQAEHDMGPYREAVEQFRYNEAIDVVWNTVRSLNQYLENVKPWEIAKQREKDTEASEHLSDVLAHAASTLLQIADLLTPFMPGTAAMIKSMFATGVVPADIQPLFPKVYLHTADPRAPKTTTSTPATQ